MRTEYRHHAPLYTRQPAPGVGSHSSMGQQMISGNLLKALLLNVLNRVLTFHKIPERLLLTCQWFSVSPGGVLINAPVALLRQWSFCASGQHPLQFIFMSKLNSFILIIQLQIKCWQHIKSIVNHRLIFVCRCLSDEILILSSILYGIFT